MPINVYESYTPIELRGQLMSNVMDTDELCAALIALCNIAAKQQKQIKDLSLQLTKVTGNDYTIN